MTRGEYGAWTRPPGIRKLNTRNPNRVLLRNRTSFALPAREGRGSYDSRDGDQWTFRRFRNDLPQWPPYTWRQDGWTDRIARSGLDLCAILDAETADAWPEYRAKRDHGRRRYADPDNRQLIEELKFIADVVEHARTTHRNMKPAPG